MASSKKGVSSHQLHRTLDITYKTRLVPVASHPRGHAVRRLARPFGSGGGTVEVDETFIGREPGTADARRCLRTR